MQNAGHQFGQGAASTHPATPFVQTEVHPCNGNTSSLRQFRKRDSLDKQSISDTSPENSSHVARVAPHNHFPARTNDYHQRYPHFPDYTFSSQVKYSEIAEPQQMQYDDHLSVIQKQKGKDYMESCNLSQAHMKQPYPAPNLNANQNYSTESIHPHYVRKEPTQISQPYKPPESQYYPKDHHTQFSQTQKLNNYPASPQARKYGPTGENDFLSRLSRINPNMARSIMGEYHLRETQTSYDQNRMYTQNQHLYASSTVPSNTYPPNYGMGQHFNYNSACSYKAPDFSRTHQMNVAARYPAITSHIDRSVSPRRQYTEKLSMPMNYAPMPQKISPTYGQYSSPEYAQHYQHRRFNQEYYPQHYRPAQYVPTPQIHPEMAETRVTISDNLKQYIENWADEDTVSEMNQMENRTGRSREDTSDETIVMLNPSELQYLENNGGIPLVTCEIPENGQYLIKNVVENSGVVRLIENKGQPAESAGDRVVNLHIVEAPKSDCTAAVKKVSNEEEKSGESYSVEGNASLENKKRETNDAQNELPENLCMAADRSNKSQASVIIRNSCASNKEDEDESQATATKETVDKNCSPTNLEMRRIVEEKTETEKFSDEFNTVPDEGATLTDGSEDSSKELTKSMPLIFDGNNNNNETNNDNNKPSEMNVEEETKVPDENKTEENKTEKESSISNLTNIPTEDDLTSITEAVDEEKRILTHDLKEKEEELVETARETEQVSELKTSEIKIDTSKDVIKGNVVNIVNNRRSRRIFSVDDIIGNKSSSTDELKKERRHSLQITQTFIDSERKDAVYEANNEKIVEVKAIEVNSEVVDEVKALEINTKIESVLDPVPEDLHEIQPDSKISEDVLEKLDQIEEECILEESTNIDVQKQVEQPETEVIGETESNKDQPDLCETRDDIIDDSEKINSPCVVEQESIDEETAIEPSDENSVSENTDEISDDNTGIQYRNAIRIEENNVLLEIGGELVEINVNVVNGKKVITVVPISETTTVVDLNDNYEPLEENLNTAQEQVESSEENEMKNEENDHESLLEQNQTETSDTNIEPVSEPIENCPENVIEPNTIIETVTEEIEEEIVENKEIEVLDDFVETEVLMDTGNEVILESDSGEANDEEAIKLDNCLSDKIPICTKAAMKAYSDDIVVNSLASTSEKTEAISEPIVKVDNENVIEIEKSIVVDKSLEKVDEEEKRLSNKSPKTSNIIDKPKNVIKNKCSDEEKNKKLLELNKKNSCIKDMTVQLTDISKEPNSILKKNRKIEKKVSPPKTKPQMKGECLAKKSTSNLDDSEEYVDFKELVKARKMKKLKSKLNESDRVSKVSQTSNKIVKPKSKLEKIVKNTRFVLKKKQTKTVDALKIVPKSSVQVKTKDPPAPTLKSRIPEETNNLRTKRKSGNFPGKPRKNIVENKTVPVVSSTKDVNVSKTKKLETIPKSNTKTSNISSKEKTKAKKVSFAEKLVQDEKYKVEKAPNHVIVKAACDSSSEVNITPKNSEENYDESNQALLDSIDNQKRKLSLQEYNFRKRKHSSDCDKDIFAPVTDPDVKEPKIQQEVTAQIEKEGSKSPEYDLDSLIISCKDCTHDHCLQSKTGKTGVNCLNVPKPEIKVPEPIAEPKTHPPVPNLTENKEKLEQRRLYDWEEDQSPVPSPIGRKCDSKTDDLTDISCFIGNKPNKCVININDLKSMPSEEISEDEMLQIYKEEVHSKLNSLSIQIPKAKTASPPNKQIGNNFSFISNEYQTLMKRFLNNEKVSHEEMEKIKQIISYKRIIEQMKLKEKDSDVDISQSPINPTYEIHNLGESDRNDIKLHLKKVTNSVNRRKRKRFKNLYDLDTSDSESAESEICDLSKNNEGDYSVIQSDSFDVGVPKLIIKRKTDLTQPVVRLERLNMDLVVKKRKFL